MFRRRPNALSSEAATSPASRRKSVAYVVGTGYGRYKVNFGNAQITEISCHARGANFLFPKTRTVIDMGGQDAKGIRVGEDGDVKDFVMNDKCAAGTGRFLSNAAETLVSVWTRSARFPSEAKKPVRLSTVCAVFVESDIMSYLAEGKTVPDILGGVHSAIAARTVALVRRVGIEPEVTFTGGVIAEHRHGEGAGGEAADCPSMFARTPIISAPLARRIVCAGAGIGRRLCGLGKTGPGFRRSAEVTAANYRRAVKARIHTEVRRCSMAYIAGIDIGSRSTKAVILDESRHVCGTALVKTRPDFPGVAKEAMEKAVAKAGGRMEDVKYVATTGLGRYNIPFRDLQITDITCAARGAAFLFPNTKCVLDVGGQSTRAIRLREGGKVKEFKSNDKCAAGSGGFLERAAHYLEIPLDQLGSLSMAAEKPTDDQQRVRRAGGIGDHQSRQRGAERRKHHPRHPQFACLAIQGVACPRGA